MATISIDVDENAANSFVSAPKEEREKLQLLLDLRLRELTNSARRPLSEIMDEIGLNAVSQGLDEKVLNSMLDDD